MHRLKCAFGAEVYILVFQWREHVRNVDGDSAVHRGALQSPSAAPEDGG